MNLLHFIVGFNIVIVVVMTAAYLYQGVYTLIGFVRRKMAPQQEAGTLHRFAALISARNEQSVIGELVASLKAQNYPAELLDIYVLADNCTDDTAGAAAAAGAIVYRRENKKLVGKGYALDELLKHIAADRGPDAYDAYFIFDADNIVDPNFVREMNKTYDRGYCVATCYRNSKNFSANWISASYSIWFLREARFLNAPRMLTGNSCAVSGTGFMVAGSIIRENGGWPFHLLTEDIQFTVDCAIKGRKIGYCDTAIVYDEQPTTFRQSWNQRLRWSKGFFQVDRHYLIPLLKGMFGRSRLRMSCYDMFMTVAPCVFLTLGAAVLNLILLLLVCTQPFIIARMISQETAHYLFWAVVNGYLGMAAYGLLTVCCEWKRIRATAGEKLRYIAAFPIFMATYIPITLVALCRNVQWTPITHYSSSQLTKPASSR